MMHNVTELFREIEPDLKGKTVTYIPTAAIAEGIEGMAEEETRMLEKMGLIVDELEVSTASRESVEEKLTKNDMVFVGGGNTFFLLQEMNRTCAGSLIKTQINAGKLFIGESAGAVVLAPDIEYSKETDNPLAAPLLKTFEALNVIDFYPVPHYQDESLMDAVERIISK